MGEVRNVVDSLRRVSSTTLTAASMNFQHLAEMEAPDPEVRTYEKAEG